MHVSRNLASESPRVTVGMPVLDNARTLRRAIDSVRRQTFVDWGLVISDDGSTDASRGVAEAASREDPRITIIWQESRQGFMNFRVPLIRAATPYFAWLAGDDYWHPDFLAETVRALEAAPTAVSALPRAAFVGDSEAPVPNLSFLEGNATERIVRYLAHPGGTRMYGLMRTEVLRSAFPVRSVNAYDWYLMVSLLRRGPQLSIPRQLLFREATGWIRYAEMVDDIPARDLFRQFPVLKMSLMLLRRGRVPAGALSALAALNLRKHEEYVAVNRPEAFLRRRGLYRRLGLPLSRNPDKLAEIAARLRDRQPERAGTADRLDDLARAVGQASATARHGRRQSADGPTVTAILACRNAEKTLQVALDHIERLGVQVIVVDHGSTDRTRQIAIENRGRGKVADIVEHPFNGVFDLTRQLRLKREIIGTLSTGWVLHADADEFLDPPAGLSLATYLSAAEKAGRIAAPSIEHLFLPLFEDEEHDPASFVRTMVSRTLMRERDPKQRLFRKDAPLDVWMQTGGHTVSRRAADLAAPPLVLRHYPGLSLDDIRAQYYSRVFSARDVAKSWHGSRMAARFFDVSEPDPALFVSKLSEAEDGGPSVTRLPVFVPRPASFGHARPETPPVDLLVLDDSPDEGKGIRRLVEAACPGLRNRVVTIDAIEAMSAPPPVLNVLRHPAGLHGHGVQRSLERGRASEWTRRIARARQWAVNRGAAYAELRIEDAETDPTAVAARLRQLFREPVLRSAAGFVGPRSKPISRRPYENPVRAISAPLAADLAYN